MENSGSAIVFMVLFPVGLRRQTLPREDRNGNGGMSPRTSPNACVWNGRACRRKTRGMQGHTPRENPLALHQGEAYTLAGTERP